MKADELKATQAPLKDLYRSTPEAALITLRASGRLGEGVTLNAVATALGIEVRDASLQAEGDLDFRGTLGVSKEAPVGFQDIRLHISLDTDASQDQVSTLIRLTERYCVVYQTLIQP